MMSLTIPTAFIPLDAAKVAQKAAHMAEVDPHGLIITIVSVSVVFVALIILYFCYSLVGDFSTGAAYSRIKKILPTKKAGVPDSDTAAAIGLALEMALTSEEDTAAAIGLALDRYFNEYVHDNESYVITIRRKQ